MTGAHSQSAIPILQSNCAAHCIERTTSERPLSYSHREEFLLEMSTVLKLQALSTPLPISRPIIRPFLERVQKSKSTAKGRHRQCVCCLVLRTAAVYVGKTPRRATDRPRPAAADVTPRDPERSGIDPVSRYGGPGKKKRHALQRCRGRNGSYQHK